VISIPDVSIVAIRFFVRAELGAPFRHPLLILFCATSRWDANRANPCLTSSAGWMQRMLAAAAVAAGITNPYKPCEER